jgi:hypothetical protein
MILLFLRQSLLHRSTKLYWITPVTATGLPPSSVAKKENF